MPKKKSMSTKERNMRKAVENFRTPGVMLPPPHAFKKGQLPKRPKKKG